MYTSSHLSREPMPRYYWQVRARIAQYRRLRIHNLLSVFLACERNLHTRKTQRNGKLGPRDTRL